MVGKFQLLPNGPLPTVTELPAFSFWLWPAGQQPIVILWQLPNDKCWETAKCYQLPISNCFLKGDSHMLPAREFPIVTCRSSGHCYRFAAVSCYLLGNRQDLPAGQLPAVSAGVLPIVTFSATPTFYMQGIWQLLSFGSCQQLPSGSCQMLLPDSFQLVSSGNFQLLPAGELPTLYCRGAANCNLLKNCQLLPDGQLPTLLDQRYLLLKPPAKRLVQLFNPQDSWHFLLSLPLFFKFFLSSTYKCLLWI